MANVDDQSIIRQPFQNIGRASLSIIGRAEGWDWSLTLTCVFQATTKSYCASKCAKCWMPSVSPSIKKELRIFRVFQDRSSLLHWSCSNRSTKYRLLTVLPPFRHGTRKCINYSCKTQGCNEVRIQITCRSFLSPVCKSKGWWQYGEGLQAVSDVLG